MSLLIDIKYAFRLLFQAPKFTAMTLGVLIGGLSISLFTFSFLYTTIYKPLPLPEGDTAKSIGIMFNGSFRSISAFEYNAVKDELTSFAEFGVYDDRDVRISVNESGKNVKGSMVRAGFFEFSRIAPILGRTIEREDTKIGADPVAVISFEVWQEEFRGSDGVLTQSLNLNGELTQIIGVMPKGYRFPNTSKVWLPMLDNVFDRPADQSDYFRAYARIKDGISVDKAELELSQAVNQIYQQNVKLYNLPPMTKSARLLTFQMAQTGGEGAIAFAFLNGISWLILLLACINVGNLLLARSIERQKETAIRAALGASTARLVSQLMWEGIIISVVGGVLAILLVGAALDYTQITLQSWLPGGGSFWWHYGMDIETIVVGTVFTFVTIMLSAFLPAWRSAHQDINLTLRDGTRGAQSKKAGRVSKILVTAQVFLVALLMLIGSISGFIAHKFINLELGDNYNEVISARLVIPENKYPEPQQQISVLQTLIEKVKGHPSVIDVVSNVWIDQHIVTLDDVEYASDQEKPRIDTISIIGNSETIGVHLVAGRQLSHLDKKGHRKNVLISQSMANRYFSGQSPLEQSFTIKIDDNNEQVFVVGVVTNRMNPRTILGKLDTEDEIYVSGLQFPMNFQNVMYRILPGTNNAEEIFYQAMFATDRNIELTYAVQPAIKNRNKMRDSMGVLSKVTFTTGFFALLLAMVGIYGLTANSVAQRTHEVGIRRAVGASDKNIISMFLKQGAKQLVIGLCLALLLFVLIAFGFHKFTEGIIPTYIYYMQASIVVVGLSLVVMFAIYTPTKRAVKMEPSTALRYE